MFWVYRMCTYKTMDSVRIIDAKGTEVLVTNTKDVEKWAPLSEFVRGMLSFGIDTTIRLSLSKNHIEGAIAYLNNPTQENYTRIQDDVRDFLGLQKSSKIDWLGNAYKIISEFLGITGRIFIWDTTPDFGEVVDNLMLTVSLYQLDTIYYDPEHTDEYIVDMLMFKARIRVVPMIPMLDTSFDTKSILFSEDTLWFFRGDSLRTGKYNAYVYGDLWTARRKNRYGKYTATPANQLMVGEVQFVDVNINQSVDYPKNTIDPIYRLVHSEYSGELLGNKAAITNLLQHIPQINSLGCYPPRFEVIRPNTSFNLNAVINSDAVIICMSNDVLKDVKMIYVHAHKISDILEGRAIQTDRRNSNAKVYSPFKLNQIIPIDIPVIVISRDVRYRYEVPYRSLNQVTYYHLT